jgi:DNA-binding Xre family transcriptional regulator
MSLFQLAMRAPPNIEQIKQLSRVVVPNVQRIKQLSRFLRFEPDRLDKEVAGELGIDLRTCKRILNKGESVGRAVIKKIADNLRCQVSDIIVSGFLPPQPEFYKNLEFGYFVDDARTPFEAGASWHAENIEFKELKAGGAGWTWFDGSITNSKHGRFTIRACLVKAKCLTILASSDVRQDAFTATFSIVASPHLKPGKKVLCGIWSGLDHLFRPAVYRMFCCEEKLDGQELRELLHTVRIVTQFEDHETALLCKSLALGRDVKVKS